MSAIGTSTKNAGFACFGSVSELLDDLSHMDEETVASILAKRYNGLQKLAKRIGKEAMEYKDYGNYEVFAQKDEALFEKCATAIPRLNKLVESAIGVSDIFSVRDQDLGAWA